MSFLKKLFQGSSSCEQAAEQANAPEASPPSPKPPGTCVGDSASLPEGGRLHAKIEGRYITVLRLDGALRCIDSICFHAGGPLGIGDIEDVNGNKCLVCPWHFYKIDVATGDKYYQGVQFVNGKMVSGDWKSNGVKQRVHPVSEVDGKIYVELSTAGPDGQAPGPIDSDEYACNAPCGDRVLNSAPSANKVRVHSVGADGKKPSGHVLRGQYQS